MLGERGCGVCFRPPAGAIPRKHVYLGRVCSTFVGRRKNLKAATGGLGGIFLEGLKMSPADGGGEGVLECEGVGESHPCPPAAGRDGCFV